MSAGCTSGVVCRYVPFVFDSLDVASAARCYDGLVEITSHSWHDLVTTIRSDNDSGGLVPYRFKRRHVYISCGLKIIKILLFAPHCSSLPSMPAHLITLSSSSYRCNIGRRGQVLLPLRLLATFFAPLHVTSKHCRSSGNVVRQVFCGLPLVASLLLQDAYATHMDSGVVSVSHKAVLYRKG